MDFDWRQIGKWINIDRLIKDLEPTVNHSATNKGKIQSFTTCLHKAGYNIYIAPDLIFDAAVEQICTKTDGLASYFFRNERKEELLERLIKYLRETKVCYSGEDKKLMKYGDYYTVLLDDKKLHDESQGYKKQIKLCGVLLAFSPSVWEACCSEHGSLEQLHHRRTGYLRRITIVRFGKLSEKKIEKPRKEHKEWNNTYTRRLSQMAEENGISTKLLALLRELKLVCLPDRPESEDNLFEEDIEFIRKIKILLENPKIIECAFWDLDSDKRKKIIENGGLSRWQRYVFNYCDQMYKDGRTVEIESIKKQLAKMKVVWSKNVEAEVLRIRERVRKRFKREQKRHRK